MRRYSGAQVARGSLSSVQKQRFHAGLSPGAVILRNEGKPYAELVQFGNIKD